MAIETKVLLREMQLCKRQQLWRMRNTVTTLN